MDTESAKITAETTGIRLRGWLRLTVQVVGLGLLLAGAYNFLLAGIADYGVVLQGARLFIWETVLGNGDEPLSLISSSIVDVVLMAVGAIVAKVAS